MVALTWFNFLEAFQKDTVYIEEFATVEQAFQRIGSFKGFVAGFKRYINNPRYDKHFQLLQHLEVKHVGKKVYFIHHTDTIVIHSTKFAKHNACLQRLGFPRIQNA
jgi:hypothetical protein